ncbi:hypothetical protein [Dactylosporangium sp. NPDC051484]|uniref:hypothetical protein n=1 Tax=Dactylosporangium sp. NPDC051484 TaxID=3154942 RepID=UPI00344CD5D2
MEFPESDFALTVRQRISSSSFATAISAQMRAPEPDLATWWTQWHLEGDVAAIVERHLREIQTHRRFQDMLEDHVRALEPTSIS